MVRLQGHQIGVNTDLGILGARAGEAARAGFWKNVLEGGKSHLPLRGYASVADNTRRRRKLREVKEACLAGLEVGLKGKRLINGRNRTLESKPEARSRHRCS